MSVQFDTIHAASLALAIAADALAPEAQGMFEDYEAEDIAGLTIHEGLGFERRPSDRGNISRMIGQAKQECLRTLRLAFEAGDVSFDELLAAYPAVKQVARELAWERWLAMNPDPCSYTYTEPETVTHERVGWHGDREVMVRPVREHWEGYEDHGFRPLVPAGDVLAFGGVA